LVRGEGHPVVLGVALLHQHLAGVGGRPPPSLRRENHPRSHFAVLEVIVQGCRTPCASPAARSIGRRRVPRGAPVARA
jgi:hypothetical protein